MELDVCVKGRRSVRAYTDEPVSKEQIEAVIEAGTWAPTGMNRQPWKFIIIQNKQLIKYVSDETKILVQQMIPSLAEQFQTEADVVCYNAPVLVLVCAEKDEQFGQVNLLDSVLAAQNMFLKAYELGLGTAIWVMLRFWVASRMFSRRLVFLTDVILWFHLFWAIRRPRLVQGREINRTCLNG